MQQPSTVTEYLDTLTRELSFDIALAHRVRQEVEDHLWEAADDSSPEAQQRVIRRFGEPREIAAQYVALSLWQQTRRAGTIVIVAVATVFLVMKGRGAWYNFVQWEPSAYLQGIKTAGFFVDYYGFKVALVAGIIGWAYISTRRVPIRFHAVSRTQLICCVLLCMLAAGPLLSSVIADAVLSGLRLLEAPSFGYAMVPLVSMTVQFMIIGVLITEIRRTMKRAALVSPLGHRQG
jgi:uncharacterized membrane protein